MHGLALFPQTASPTPHALAVDVVIVIALFSLLAVVVVAGVVVVVVVVRALFQVTRKKPVAHLTSLACGRIGRGAHVKRLCELLLLFPLISGCSRSAKLTAPRVPASPAAASCGTLHGRQAASTRVKHLAAASAGRPACGNTCRGADRSLQTSPPS